MQQNTDSLGNKYFGAGSSGNTSIGSEYNKTAWLYRQ